MSKIKVLIVDDHAILRMGLTSLLNGKNDFEVAGEAADGETAIKKSLKLRPDVIVMDLMLPGMDGAETTRRIIENQPGAKILILTTFGTSDGIARSLRAGALGAILKNADFKDLTEAIKTVAEGNRYLSEEVAQIMSEDPPSPDLSPRQSEVLQCMVRGLSNPDIAKVLDISLAMVKEHSVALFQKIGAANRTEAVAIAMRKHLVDL